MKISIKKVCSVQDCIVCNKMLEELIQFESKLDCEINENYKIVNFYERTLNKDDSIIFLATCNNSPVGYIMAYKEKPNEASKSNTITIMNLFIKHEYRNKKIGTKLIDEVEKWAESLCENYVIELDCIFNNEMAIKFYKKLGYHPVRIKLRKDFKE